MPWTASRGALRSQVAAFARDPPFGAARAVPTLLNWGAQIRSIWPANELLRVSDGRPLIADERTSGVGT